MEVISVLSSQGIISSSQGRYIRSLVNRKISGLRMLNEKNLQGLMDRARENFEMYPDHEDLVRVTIQELVGTEQSLLTPSELARICADSSEMLSDKLAVLKSSISSCHLSSN